MPNVTGVIGISAAMDLARYSLFYDSMFHIKTPPGTSIIHARGGNIAINRNSITQQALDVGAEWIWFVDDDHVFQPDTLNHLLARDVDVVSGLYVQKQFPFIPHAYDAPEDKETGTVTSQYLRPSESGMQHRLAVGAGCFLAKTKVFKALEPPYWRLGQLAKEQLSEDIELCRRIREKGFDIWCDYDVPIGHLFVSELWPIKEPGGNWDTGLIHQKEVIMLWPAIGRDVQP